ncbi:monovalent cation/H+ antiporter subunit E [Methanobrevibacter filiformis]|uniref:Putative monovalent cation/H+ antiporter subunit E n=1 Tax=Methanobrevibacter filiformis TaxID=55758 RepID=A0A166C068_9EURY|nr:monovalent cation/H+ antiporter subunit E [Methanobrevibacter filiformis]KZX13993.1 putative monovalent cation/H+ antiporter subunit E [Methanobrevibacter filiformis]
MFLTRFYYGILYFLVLIYEIIKATIDTSIRSITGKIDPVIVDIETELKRPISQTILANSITLTPGTLSIDVDSDKQIIKVAIISPRSVDEVIPFEPYIKKMLE